MNGIRLILRVFVFLIATPPLTCLAQSAISGKILDMTGSKPIANASVFLSNATVGDKTADDGTFTLHNIKPGKYQLVVSVIGFETYTQLLMVGNGDIKLPDIPMMSKTFLLNEVKIKPKDDRNRDHYYILFQDNFLGTSELTKQCRIVNPEIIDFDYDNKTHVLKASSADFLIIENKALGYTLKYLLSGFMMTDGNVTEKSVSYKGFVLFEEMKESEQQIKRWQKVRQQVYENSSVHFLRALLDQRIGPEGFKVQQLAIYYNPERPADTLINSKIKYYTALTSKTNNTHDSLSYWVKKSKIKKDLLKLNPYPLTDNEIIQKTNQPGLYALGCENDALYVTYNKYGQFEKKGYISNVDDRYNTENSLVKFSSSYAFFDNNGWISNPESVQFSGVWARQRIAELLPQDYEPSNIKISRADTGLTNIMSAMTKYSAGHATEKTYSHLDKTNYMPGDTIWFKAYVVSGENHALSAISNVAHVELLNAKDSVISQIALPLSSGIGWGDISLPALVKPGKYQLRAYTNWMRNDDPSYFFNQQINIGDLQTVQAKKNNIIAKPDVQFFPEGGLLINGLRSKVAVKSVNEKGLGEDVEGLVTDNEDNEVAQFKTQHLGMGIFAITPAAGKLYKVKITCKNGSRYSYDLPKTHDEGFAIAINNTLTDSLSIRIAASNKLFEAQQGAGYYLLAQSGGKICYTAGFRLVAQSFNTVIDKKRFPTGITRFTLFAANGEPLNERVVFIQNNDALKLNIMSAGKTFATRQKVKLSLDAKTADHRNITGSFSVSVINEDFVPGDELSENTILNNLLLTSDIKGHIEQPNYYFTEITDKTRADLDILMLTQGYHRFKWKQVLANKDQQPAFEAEKSLQISGYVKTLDGKPVPGGKVKLLTTKSGIFMLDTVTNENGKFSFNRLPEDSARYVIQARTDKDKKNVMIVLDTLSGYKHLVVAELPAEKDTVKELTTYQKQVKQQLKLSLDKRVIQLKEVVIKAKPEPERDPFAHADQPDQVITNFPKESAIGLKSFLVNKLRNVVLMDPDNDKIFEFYSARAIARDVKHVKPLMVKLDGAVVSADTFDSIMLTEIERAELITTTGKMDMTTGAKEVLYLISRKQRGNSKPSTPDVITYQSNGLYKAREFYSPKYDKINQSYPKPDLRTTIYWNPTVIVDNGATEFEFFNADTKGTYRVTIEGVDTDGNLGRIVYRYNVE